MQFIFFIILFRLLLILGVLCFLQKKLCNIKYKVGKYILPFFIFLCSLLFCISISGAIKEKYTIIQDNGTILSFDSEEETTKKADELLANNITFKAKYPTTSEVELSTVVIYFVGINMITVLLLIISLFSNKINRNDRADYIMKINDL